LRIEQAYGKLAGVPTMPKPRARASLAVVDAPVADLHPWDRNPRKIKPARLEQLKRMLIEAPDMLHARPLIALPDGTVIAGNQRLAAAEALGWETIPTIYADLGEDEAIEWALRDNNPAGETVDDLAALLLADLSSRGRELDLTGFAPADLSALLRRIAPPSDPDAVPEPPTVPRSVRGEVYELGPHRLMCGDATSADDVAALLDGERPMLLVTDPPYGVNYDPAWRNVEAAKGNLAYAARRVGEVTNDDRADWRAAWELFTGGVNKTRGSICGCRSSGRNRTSRSAAATTTYATSRAGTPSAPGALRSATMTARRLRYGRSTSTGTSLAATAPRSQSSAWPARSETTSSTRCTTRSSGPGPP
jgi:hypothetical protein